MIDLSKYPQLNHITTLKQTSKDDRENKTVSYMTKSERKVINFDDVKNDYVKDLKLTDIPKSNDALFEKENGKLVFVEFKNGYMDKAKELGQFAKEEYVHFGIKMFENYCFEKVHTYNEEEFDSYLKTI